MTEGTSQGLFIVVAIVIFGIFTLMAYILFEDTLSPALASMFTDASEQANNKLLGAKDSHNIELFDVMYVETISKDKNAVTIKSRLEDNGGLRIPMRHISSEVEKYKLTFNMKLLDGDVTYIGGHLGGKGILNGSGISNVEIRIDNNRVIPEDVDVSNNDWYTGVKIPDGYTVGDTISVEVSFTRDFFAEDDYEGNPIYIHPNRNWGEGGKYLTEYTVHISEITLIELL